MAFTGCRPQLPSVKPGAITLEDAEKTIAQLSDSIRKDKTNPKTYLACGKAYLQKAEILRRRQISWDLREEVADQLEQAVDLLSKGSTLDSMSAELHYYRGVALSSQGADWPTIISSLETARRLDPNNVRIVTDLGSAYLRRSGIWLGSYFDRSRLPAWIERSREILESAVALEPGYAKSHVRLGDVYFVQGHFQKALEQYREAIALGIQDPDDCLRLSYLYPLCAGESLHETFRWVPDVAKLALIPAFALRPSFQGMQLHLLQRAAALDTNYVRALAWLIPQLVADQDTALAVKCYFKLRQIEPTSSLSYFASEVGPAHGFYSWDGVDFFRSAIRQNPNSSLLHRDLGDLYSGILEMNVTGKGVRAKDQTAGHFYTYLDSAIAEYERAIRLDPQAGAPHAGLASVYSKQGDTTQALNSYRNALAANDTTIAMSAIQGLIDINRLEDASRLVRDLLKHPRRRSKAYVDIASSYFVRGNIQRAEELFLKSLAENERNSEADEAMGRIYARRSNDSYRSLLGCDVVAHDGVLVATITADASGRLSFLKANIPRVWFNLLEPNSASPAGKYNLESPYGGLYGSLSPFSCTTTMPPRLMRGKSFVSYLTDNPTIKPRVSATRLVGYLSELQQSKNSR